MLEWHKLDKLDNEILSLFLLGLGSELNQTLADFYFHLDSDDERVGLLFNYGENCIELWLNIEFIEFSLYDKNCVNLVIDKVKSYLGMNENA